jgi:DNA-binding winged helix-turn-helix (wHTH) protein/TolB-like protein
MPDGLYKFGIFEFDSATGELRREGELVRMEAQPAQVLGLLLERAGETVTRDELRQRVWGSDTFVDFDRGLNYCVAQIRSALQDSAQSPRFVRTLPKRGYQFIAPVSGTGDAQPGCAVLEPRIEPRRRIWRSTWVLSGAAALMLLISVYALTRGATADPFSIAVLRFDNETGDATLDQFAGGLTDSLVADLTAAGTGRFGVIGHAAILRQPRSQRDIVAIGSQLHASYIILGQVQRQGSEVRVLAHLIRLPDQTHVWVSRADFPMDDPLKRESEFSRRAANEFLAHLSPGADQKTASHPSASNSAQGS